MSNVWKILLHGLILSELLRVFGSVIVHTSNSESIQNKKMSDVSAHLMILIASGMFLWVIYGFIRSDPVIIGTNATGFALNIALLAMKLRYDKMQSVTVKA